MNDPHVVTLHYKVEHAFWIDYSKAGPLEFRERAFDVRVVDERVLFSMNDHFATEQKARDAVEDFIQGWKLDAALARGSGAFKLRFDNADIVDRNPTPGAIHARPHPIRVTVSLGQPQVTVSPRDFPELPSTRLTPSPDAESMFFRYAGYREGREPLATMAHFCLDVLRASTGKR